MTLEGTNTYVVAAPEARTAVVIDPGPPHPDHDLRVMRATRGRQVELVLVTHGHRDHAEGALGLARTTGAPLAALDPALASAGAPRLGAGVGVEAGGVRLECVPTPGHAPDHCCFLLAGRRLLFSGDHVLGRGYSVVAWPDGDIRAYLASLELLLGLELGRLLPGHGPPVDDAAAKVTEYLEHRRERERQLLAALAAGDRTPAELVARVYAGLDPALRRPAERSVRAHLDKLRREGRVTGDGDTFTPV